MNVNQQTSSALFMLIIDVRGGGGGGGRSIKNHYCTYRIHMHITPLPSLAMWTCLPAASAAARMARMVLLINITIFTQDRPKTTPTHNLLQHTSPKCLNQFPWFLAYFNAVSF